MSRSNDPNAFAGRHVPQRRDEGGQRDPRYAESGYGNGQYPAAHDRYAHHGYPPGPGQPGGDPSHYDPRYAQPGASWPQELGGGHGYAPPADGYGQSLGSGYGHDHSAGDRSAGSPHYAPQFDTYSGAPHHTGHGSSHGARQGGGLGALTGQGHPGQTDLRGSTYDQWPDPGRQRTDGFDLGSYMPSGAHQGHDPRYAQPGYPPSQGYGEDPHAGYQPADLPHESQAVAGRQAAGTEGHYDDEDDEYEDEPSGGRGRTVMIVGALVAAIAVGGGLAYGYKTFFAKSGSGDPPVIRADGRPAKTAPADPGGKQFANTGSKIMGRLGDQPQVAAGASATEQDGARVRSVSTLVIGKDGTITAPPAPSGPVTLNTDPTPPATQGVAIIGGGTVLSTPSQPPSGSPGPSAPNQAAAGSAAPRVVIAAPVATPAPPPPAKAAAGANVTVDPPAKAPAAPRTSAPPPAQPDAAAAPAQKVAANGYVAVLSSQKSRIDALKTFADLQQQYSSVLQGKVPDVLEADLSARNLGTVYRVVVGPPASRQAAATVCNQLKTAGYTGCWVTGY